MGQHQAKVDSSGPSPPPIFGYEPGYGAYPLGNPPKEVLAIQQSRKNGEVPSTFAPVTMSPIPGSFPFPPFQGRPAIPVDISAFLANAPPFPKGPNEDNQPAKTSVPNIIDKSSEYNKHIDIDFDIADLEVPCDPGKKLCQSQLGKNDKTAKFFMNSLLDISSSTTKPSEAVPTDPSERSYTPSSVNLEETKNFQETYYDEPANESTQPPPLPPRMTSLPQKNFFNPFGMLPTPVHNIMKSLSDNIFTTNAEEIVKTSLEDQRSEKDMVAILASLIRFMPVLWAPKFTNKFEIQQVEDAWEEIGRKVGCTTVWSLQRMKIVWLTNVAKFKKSIHNKSFEYYKDMEFLIPVMKVRTDTATPVRKAGRKSGSASTFMQEYEDDYIPPQKIRNIAFAGL